MRNKMNWYKIAQNVQDISQIAADVRRAILNTQDDNTLRDKCLPASRHLAKILIDKGYAAASVIKGVFTIDNPNPEAIAGLNIEDFGGDEDMMKSAAYSTLHYWVQINNMVIDITASQFNDELDSPLPEIVIGDLSSLGRYTVMVEDCIEPKIMYK